jgi:hypothetical protein
MRSAKLDFLILKDIITLMGSRERFGNIEGVEEVFL